MNEKTLECLRSLSSALNEDKRILSLSLEEEKALNNEEVRDLSKKLKDAADEYEEACRHYGEESREALASRKKLHAAKLALDSKPECLSYSKALAEANTLLWKIEDILFGDIKKAPKIGGSRD